MKSEKRIQTYAEFWPFYLSQHAHPRTKLLHVVGTLTGIGIIIGCFVGGRPLWAPLGLVFAYGLAWYSHFFIENNRPATFQYPLWSFISDFRMLYWVLTGKL